MIASGSRHLRCGGVWRGPLFIDDGPVWVCNTCGEESTVTPKDTDEQQLAEVAVEAVAGEFIRADELELGDLIVDEHGERKFAAFDIARLDDRVRVWPAAADIDRGWHRDGLTFEASDTLLVVRR